MRVHPHTSTRWLVHGAQGVVGNQAPGCLQGIQPTQWMLGERRSLTRHRGTDRPAG